MTDTRMATKRQTWALFCITKKDYRDENLTFEQASDLIAELGNPSYVKKSTVNKGLYAAEIMNEAVVAGLAALHNVQPTPMVVQQHALVMDDNSPVTKGWIVEGGCCGFAWVTFKANTTENRKFLASLKAAGMVGDGKAWGKSGNGAGFSYWVHQGGQSMQRKEAFAHAFAKVLISNGITVSTQSRMD